MVNFHRFFRPKYGSITSSWRNILSDAKQQLLRKLFLKILAMYFNTLDIFVTKHFNHVNFFMEFPSYLSIQQFGHIKLAAHSNSRDSAGFPDLLVKLSNFFFQIDHSFIDRSFFRSVRLIFQYFFQFKRYKSRSNFLEDGFWNNSVFLVVGLLFLAMWFGEFNCDLHGCSDFIGIHGYTPVGISGRTSAGLNRWTHLS